MESSCLWFRPQPYGLGSSSSMRAWPHGTKLHISMPTASLKAELSGGAGFCLIERKRRAETLEPVSDGRQFRHSRIVCRRAQTRHGKAHAGAAFQCQAAFD